MALVNHRPLVSRGYGKSRSAQSRWSMSGWGHSRPRHSVPEPINVRCYSNRNIIVQRSEVTLRAMCGRLQVGKENLHVAGLVGAAMCSASHDGISVWAIRDPRWSSHFCRLPCKPHIRRELIPTTFPHSGTGELQENGTSLCRRRRSAMPNNGAVPSDRRTALRSQRNPDC